MPVTRVRLFSPLPTPAEMAAWDRESIQRYRIPEFALMENASREAFHVSLSLTGPGAKVLVYMGRGNNGGDGAALARHLHDAGRGVLVLHAHPLEALSGVAAEHAALAMRVGVPFLPALAEMPEEWRETAQSPGLVVDALLGTGFSGELRELERDLVRRINALRERARVFSLDVPSGLDALTGRPRPEAVKAHHTVTFEAAKVGLCLPEAAPYTGELHVRPIGIPHAVQKALPASFRLLAPAELPPPSPFMHKGDAGRVLVIGGSPEFAGAPQLAALGALRAGAGLVTVACPAELAGAVRETWPEIMVLPLGAASAWSEAMIEPLLETLKNLSPKSAVVLGPGLGRSLVATALVEAVLGLQARPSLVLDADGLFPLTPDSCLPGLLREDDCITPHPGEAAHMLGLATEAVQADRPAAMRALAERCAATVLLKGAGTLIGQKNAPITLAPFAAPALAVGGSGDVLSGVIAALLARRNINDTESALHAVCLGAYFHGKAGEILARRYPQRGALAREIADAVAEAAAVKNPIPLSSPGA